MSVKFGQTDRQKYYPLVLRDNMSSFDTKERHSCWALTIYSEEEANVARPPGWTLKGQWERGEKEGRLHLQAMLLTPQVRGSAVKSIFPKAHIEPARNKKALTNYVAKEDTRVAPFETKTTPNIFQYQEKVAAIWDKDVFHDMYMEYIGKMDEGDIALKYVDNLCSGLIAQGAQGLEFIAVNPMWRSSWKRFYTSIIARNGKVRETQVPQGEEGQQGEEVP